MSGLSVDVVGFGQPSQVFCEPSPADAVADLVGLNAQNITDAPYVTDIRRSLLGMTLPEMTDLMKEAKQPAFRGRQLFEWVYQKAVFSFDEMTNLPISLRTWLSEKFTIGHAEVAQVQEASDGSRKILYRLQDGKIIESVLMPERDWMTLCISSQVGCAVACTFCMTGFGGFRRHMSAGEILSQILLAKHVNGGEFPRNLVFMGMGEPLLNLDNVLPALRLITDESALGFAPRRVTVSTSGILPGIERLGEEDLGVNIAISLNASNNEFRDQVMPINRKWPIEALLETCRNFPLRRRRLITFEYVMLGGLNDAPANARELAELVDDLPCKINLIPWNPDPHLPYSRPAEETVRRFQQILLDYGYGVSVRYSKAVDIGGACGQLAGHWEAEQKAVAADNA